MKSFLVLDQNALRTEELRNLIETDKHANFVIVDAAILELCKSPEWESTVRRSLEALSKCPGRVHAAVGLGEAFRIEIAALRSIDGKMLSRRHTGFIRDLLSAVASGGRSRTLDVLAESHERVAADLRENELNHLNNKKELMILMVALKEMVGEDFTKGLRSRAISKEERLKTIGSIAPEIVSEFLRDIEIPSSKFKEFLRRKPLVLRQIYAKVGLCLNWIALGGIESLKPNDVTNDILDLEYVLVATFFHGIMSREKRVNEAYADISELLRGA